MILVTIQELIDDIKSLEKAVRNERNTIQRHQRLIRKRKKILLETMQTLSWLNHSLSELQARRFPKFKQIRKNLIAIHECGEKDIQGASYRATFFNGAYHVDLTPMNK